jgi:hypothetical protein
LAVSDRLEIARHPATRAAKRNLHMRTKLATLVLRGILSVLTGAVVLGLWVAAGLIGFGTTWTAAILLALAAFVWGCAIPSKPWLWAIGISLGIWLAVALLGDARSATFMVYLAIFWTLLWVYLGAKVGHARQRTAGHPISAA